MNSRDTELQEQWKLLADIPVIDNGLDDVIDTDFYIFKSGTPRFEIWHWFDQEHSNGVKWLMDEIA